MSTLYTIRRGTIERQTIPSSGVQLPLDEYNAKALPGYENENIDWALQRVSEIGERMAPWLVWHAAPSFWEATHNGDFSGLAWTQRDAVFLCTNANPVSIISVAIHEIWHMLDGHLTAAEVADVDAMATFGSMWPTELLDSLQERRARAFEHWAMAALHTGVMPRFDGTLGRRVTRLYQAAWSGAIAERLLRRRSVPAAAVSAARHATAAARVAAMPWHQRVWAALQPAAAL